MDYVMKKMILSYELMKNQAYVDRLLKEGELKGYKKIKQLYLQGEVEDTIMVILSTKISLSSEELQMLKAKEDILNEMNSNLEELLSTMDITNLMKKAKYPKDVQARISQNLCALKRPGKGGFNCDEELIKGSKYCRSHLEKFDKVRFTDLIDE